VGVGLLLAPVCSVRGACCHHCQSSGRIPEILALGEGCPLSSTFPLPSRLAFGELGEAGSSDVSIILAKAGPKPHVQLLK